MRHINLAGQVGRYLAESDLDRATRVVAQQAVDLIKAAVAQEIGTPVAGAKNGHYLADLQVELPRDASDHVSAAERYRADPRGGAGASPVGTAVEAALQAWARTQGFESFQVTSLYRPDGEGGIIAPYVLGLRLGGRDQAAQGTDGLSGRVASYIKQPPVQRVAHTVAPMVARLFQQAVDAQVATHLEGAAPGHYRAELQLVLSQEAAAQIRSVEEYNVPGRQDRRVELRKGIERALQPWSKAQGFETFQLTSLLRAQGADHYPTSYVLTVQVGGPLPKG